MVLIGRQYFQIKELRLSQQRPLTHSQVGTGHVENWNNTKSRVF